MLAGARTRTPRRALLLHACAAVVLLVALALSDGLAGHSRDVVQQALQALAALALTGLLVVRCRQIRSLLPSWTWAGRAMGLWALGQTTLTAWLVAGSETRPWVADLLFLAASGAAVRAAVLAAQGACARTSRARVALDATVVAATVCFLVQARVAPALDGAGLVALVYPLIDAGIITVLVVAVVRGPRAHARSLGCAALGLLVLAIANLEGLRLAADGESAGGAVLSGAFVLGLWLVGLGALVQRDELSPGLPAAPRLTQELLPYLGVPIVLLVAVTQADRSTVVQQALLVLLAALLSLRHVHSVMEATRAREDLGASEHRYRRVVETAQEGIWLSDVQGRATLVNDRACSMLGLRPEEIVGRQSVEVMQPFLDELGRGTVQRRNEARHETGVYELRVVRPDGTVMHCHVVSTPLHDDEGRFDGTLTMATDVTSRVELEQRLWQEARTDPLTALANRLLLQERVDEELAAGGSLALVYCDLDGFKAVNDSFGHAQGDALLRQVAARLTATAPPGVLVSRLGGDEFALLCPATTACAAATLARRVQTAMVTPFEVVGRSHHVSASIGVADTDGTLRFDGLLRNADLAMYAAKADPASGSVRVFEPEMHAAVVSHAALEQDLRTAVSRDQLIVLHQPVVELATGRIVGAEALVRWQHPERGLLVPDQFIDVAEMSGAVVELGQRVLEIAVRDAARWRSVALLVTSVNVSPRQLVEPEAVERIVATVLGSGLPPDRFLLEITERSLLSGEAARAAIVRLREVGIRIALDDFGTGWSSLSHLRDHRIDVLKLDQSYVQASDDEASGRVLRAALDLARSFDLQSTAEGIETQEQADRAAAAGCTYAQGYLFGRPMTADDLVERLRAQVARAPRQRRSSEGSAARQQL